MFISLLVAAATAWLYAATLQGLVVEWFSSADASYGVVLAGVAAVVVWRRREAFRLALDPHSSTLPGLSALLSGLGLYLVAQLAADVFLTRISFVFVVAGAIWFLAGSRALRVVAPPLVFLLIAVPLPALVLNAITLPLQIIASRIGETTLIAAGVSVFRDGNLLELPSTTLEIADACSGLRSIVSLTAIGGLLAWTEPSWPRRLALVGCRPWHTADGWLTFVVSMAVLLQLQRLLPAPKPAPAWELDPVRA